MASLSRIGTLSARRGASVSRASLSPKLNPPLSSRSLSTLYTSPALPRLQNSSHARVLAYSLASRSFSWSPARSSSPATPTPSSAPTSTEPIPLLETTTTAAPSTDALSSIPAPPTEELSVATEIIQHTGDQLGDLAALGLAAWTPPGIVQQLLEQFHVGLGLPWWGSIILLSAVVRIALFRMQAKAAANNSRIATVSDDIQKLVAEMKDAQARRDTPGMARVQQKMMGIYAKAGGHPLKGLIPVVIQMPVAISMFFGVRKMCQLPVESMKTGGMWWFTDLTASDPTFVLPVMSTGAMLLMLQLSAADSPQTAASGHMRNAFKVMSIVFLPFMAMLPNGVFMYFITNGLLLGVQTALFRLPVIRDWAGIVPPKSGKAITTGSPLTAQALLSGSKPASAVDQNPSILDSLRALVDAYKKRVNDAMEEKKILDDVRKRTKQRDEARLIPKAPPTIQAKKRVA